jgi:hypothetical protein
LLQVLFCGGVIRGKKIQRGNVFEMDELMKTASSFENPNTPNPEMLANAYNVAYLF